MISITDNDTDDTFPQINDKKQIVWLGFDGSDSEIFFFDGKSTIQLTDNEYSDISPVLNSNGQVVWSGYDGSDFEIFSAIPMTLDRILEKLMETISELESSGDTSSGYMTHLDKINGFIDKGKITAAMKQLKVFIKKIEVDMNQQTLSEDIGQGMVTLLQAAIDYLDEM